MSDGRAKMVVYVTPKEFDEITSVRLQANVSQSRWVRDAIVAKLEAEKAKQLEPAE